ncbi:MAG TPA: NfeD family protein, partial [Candidatus Didemnitutus sp.]|nr:NfeD family protein [Candidatus Didemnitutus sp.]
LVLGVSGLLLMLAALFWSMLDLWPNEPISISFSGDTLVAPLSSLGLGLAIAVTAGAILLRFLPDRWFWDKMAVSAVVGGVAQTAGGAPQLAGESRLLVGRVGQAVTALRPGGQVEIDGHRYEARAALGAIDAGARIVVQEQDHFALVVREERA